MPKPDIDLSFARYVAARKGEASARSREGAAYAYGGDIKVRAALDRIRPVTLAVEATVRLWQSVEKSRMLGHVGQGDRQAVPAHLQAGRALRRRAAHPGPHGLRVAEHRLAERAHVRHRRRSLHRPQRRADRSPVRAGAAGRHRPRVRPHPEQPRRLHDDAALPAARGQRVPALERQARRAGAERLGAARGDHLRPRRPDLHARPRRVDRLPGQAGARLAEALQRGQHRGVPRAARRGASQASGGWTS